MLLKRTAKQFNSLELFELPPMRALRLRVQPKTGAAFIGHSQHGLSSARAFFRLLFRTYGERLEKAASEGQFPAAIDEVSARRELMFFQNLQNDVTFDGRAYNLYAMYLRVLLDLKNMTNLAAAAPDLHRRLIESFCDTVATLMCGIRRARTL